MRKNLSRFFLQLPMDPVDYNKVRVVWFGAFFFTGLAFGLRHSGLNCQRATDDAVSWILCWLVLEMDKKSDNYVDAFEALG